MNIFDKIYTKDKNQALIDIINLYKKNSYLIVNYIYFANLVLNWIIWNKKLNKEYLEALNIGDFLLPDWIALNIFVKKHFKKEVPNLNWTDFSDFLIKSLDKNDFNLILYWAKKDIIKKASENISKKYNLDIFYYQDWYSEFDFEKLKDLKKDKINILMVWLWTPLQEIWVKNNIENIKKYKLLVFTQWWTFDFWWEVEKRAPKVFIKLKLEWFWRLLTNPKKNFKKVLYSFYLFYYLFKKIKKEQK